MHGLLPSFSSSCLRLARGILIEITFVAARAAARSRLCSCLDRSAYLLDFRYCGTLLDTKDSLT